MNISILSFFKRHFVSILLAVLGLLLFWISAKVGKGYTPIFAIYAFLLPLEYGSDESDYGDSYATAPSPVCYSLITYLIFKIAFDVWAGAGGFYGVSGLAGLWYILSATVPTYLAYYLAYWVIRKYHYTGAKATITSSLLFWFVTNSACFLTMSPVLSAILPTPAFPYSYPASLAGYGACLAAGLEFMFRGLGSSIVVVYLVEVLAPATNWVSKVPVIYNSERTVVLAGKESTVLDVVGYARLIITQGLAMTAVLLVFKLLAFV